MKSTPYIHACLCMYVNIHTCTQYNVYLIELYIYILHSIQIISFSKN